MDYIFEMNEEAIRLENAELEEQEMTEEVWQAKNQTCFSLTISHIIKSWKFSSFS